MGESMEYGREWGRVGLRYRKITAGQGGMKRK